MNAANPRIRKPFNRLHGAQIDAWERLSGRKYDGPWTSADALPKPAPELQARPAAAAPRVKYSMPDHNLPTVRSPSRGPQPSAPRPIPDAYKHVVPSHVTRFPVTPPTLVPPRGNEPPPPDNLIHGAGKVSRSVYAAGRFFGATVNELDAAAQEFRGRRRVGELSREEADQLIASLPARMRGEHQPMAAAPERPPASTDQMRYLHAAGRDAGLTHDDLQEMAAERCGAESMKDLSRDQAADLIAHVLMLVPERVEVSAPRHLPRPGRPFTPPPVEKPQLQSPAPAVPAGIMPRPPRAFAPPPPRPKQPAAPTPRIGRKGFMSAPPRSEKPKP